MSLARVASYDLTRHQLGPSEVDAAEAVAHAQLTEFDRCKKNCHRLDKETRDAIKERDELLNRGTKSIESIKLSSTSRQKLAALRAEAAKMETLFQAEKKKAEKSAGKKVQGLLQEDQIVEKQSYLELVKARVEGTGT